MEGPADIVFEILSLSTRTYDLEQKLPLYLEKGVQEVWIIDPEDQSISRYAKENVVEQAKGEQFVWSNVLSPFGLTPTWLWGTSPSAPSECLSYLLKES